MVLRLKSRRSVLFPYAIVIISAINVSVLIFVYATSGTHGGVYKPQNRSNHTNLRSDGFRSLQGKITEIDSASMSHTERHLVDVSLKKKYRQIDLSSKLECDEDCQMEIQRVRKQTLRDQCRALGMEALNLSKILDKRLKRNLHHFLVLDDYKTIYSYVPKAGCTNWKRVFLVLSGRANSTQTLGQKETHLLTKKYIRSLNNYKLDEIKFRLENYTKFTFVRDPFARILSAYRDKLEVKNSRNEQFRTGISARIKRLTALFQQFNVKGAELNTTFHEFVDYLITHQDYSDSAEEHWIDMYKLNLPCLVSYDFVGRVESLQRDADFVFKNIIKVSSQNITFRSSTNPTNSSDRDKLKVYFSDVPSKDIKALYERYAPDFKLFGYGYPHDLVQNCVYLNPDDVKTYLSAKPWLLREYVLEFFQLDEVKGWFEQQSGDHRHGEKSRHSRYISQSCDGDVNKISQDLSGPLSLTVKCVEDQKNVQEVLMPSMACIANIVNADEYFLFMVSAENKSLHLCVNSNGRVKTSVFGPCKPGTTVAAYAVTSKRGFMTSDILGDERFPLGVGMNDSQAKSVICVPVLQPNGEVPAVLELIRHYNSAPFTQTEYEVCTGLVKQREFNDFLLEVSRVIFDDCVAIDILTEHIMKFAKDLVSADRCTLFLVDAQTEELYADLFDEGLVRDGKPYFTKKKQIRFSIEKGIAGHVAKTGEVVNIPNAYNDPRFNREVDIKTGYTTRNILCMPIVSRGSIIGVVQMINKRGPPHIFDQNDESNFRMFAIYCALALHYSKVYSTFQQSERILAVTQEQLSYHCTCTDNEAERLVNRWNKHSFTIPPNFHQHDFDCKQYERILPELFIEMVHDLFGPDEFDLHVLARFILTVRKNYRPIPFHNFNHGFAVAHAMCFVMSNTPGLFTTVEMMASLFASLCHDVDHRGRTNAFLRKYTSKLGLLYPTGSLLEQHHFNHIMSILQMEGHNIFGHLPLNIYKQVISTFKHMIMSTDLALSFGTLQELDDLVTSGSFDLEDHTHRSTFLAVVMTVCDLNAVSKLWPTQRDTVESIYLEFYAEGDEEKSLGGQPLGLFDRDNKEHQVEEQVFFISKVAMPNFVLLAKILPCVEPMVEATKDNLAQWEREGAGQSTEMWAVSTSRLEEPATTGPEKSQDPGEEKDDPEPVDKNQG